MKSPDWMIVRYGEPGRVIGVPGSAYRSSELRSHNLRGALPGESMIHVRVHRRSRSNSFTSATFLSVHRIERNRYSVFVSSAGSPLNGAANDISRSRCGTLTFGSPWSSASAHTSVAGAVPCHTYSRGP